MNDIMNETSITSYMTVAEGVVNGQIYDMAFITETDGSTIVCLRVGDEIRRITVPAQTEGWWAQHLNEVDPSGFAEFLGRTRVSFDIPDEEEEEARYPDFSAGKLYDTDLRENSAEEWLMRFHRVGEGTARVIASLFPEDLVVRGIASFPDENALYDTIKAALPPNQGFPLTTAKRMREEALKLVEEKALEF